MVVVKGMILKILGITKSFSVYKSNNTLKSA
jgi:hypothetical protein